MMPHTTPINIDASKLPASAFGEKAPLWWGNLLLILIETTTIALLVASYYYLRMNYDAWPPPKVDVYPVQYDPVPYLGVATFNMLMLLGSCLPMYWTDMAARRKEEFKTRMGLTFMFIVSVIGIVLSFFELRDTRFWWNDNAYASIVWVTLCLHLTYILAGSLEFLVMGAWIWTHEIDDKHALDVTLAGGYWYWVTGIGVIVYAVVFLSPRWV